MDTRTGTTLSLTHDMAVSAAAIWRCWSEPTLLSQWFCPAPWRYQSKTIELRAGGTFHGAMIGPEGQEFDNTGLILDAIPENRIVFSNMFTTGWVPQTPDFGMVAVISLIAKSAQDTTYHAQVHHWTDEACDTHENMGFFAGWHAACDQLEALAKTL